MWAFHIGWAVFFLPLLLKTYRLLQVFTAAKNMKRKTISTKMLLGVLTAWVVCVEVLICSLWSGILKPRGVSTYMTDTRDPYLLREYKTCLAISDQIISSDNQGNTAATSNQAGPVYSSASISTNSAHTTLLTISSCANGLLVFGGVVLAIRTRNISSKFSESNQQAAMMYNSGVFTALVVVLFLAPTSSPHSSARAQVSCMMLCLTLNMLILFVPKLFDLSDDEMSSMSKSIANKMSGKKKSKGFEHTRSNPDNKWNKKGKRTDSSHQSASYSQGTEGESVADTRKSEPMSIELTPPGPPDANDAHTQYTPRLHPRLIEMYL